MLKLLSDCRTYSVAVAGLGYILTFEPPETCFTSFIAQPVVLVTVFVMSTGLSSKYTPARLFMAVPSGRPCVRFIVNITAPLQRGQSVVSKRLIPGKSNLTML